VNFEDWAEQNNLSEYGKACSRAAWQAAQEAERERILKIVEQVGIQGNHDVWFDCCDTVVERIKNGLDT